MLVAVQASPSAGLRFYMFESVGSSECPAIHGKCSPLCVPGN